MNKKIIFSLVVSSIIVFSGTSVFASDFIFDNFETYTSGQKLSNQNYVWTAYDGSSSTVTYFSNAYSGVNVITGTKGNHFTFTPSENGSINFYAYTSSNTSGTFFFGNRNGTSWKDIHGFSINGSSCSNDTISGYNIPNGSYDTISLPSDCSNDNWSLYTIEWKNENDILYARIGIDGNFTDYYSMPTSFQSVSDFSFMLGGGVLIDDVRVSSPAYVSAVNGSCGSANGGSFFQIPSTNLCSSGTLDFGVVNDGETFVWSCAGSGGGSNEFCYASVLNTTAQCGYLANTQYADSSPPSGFNACLSGSVRDMLQLDDDSWLWYCEVSDDDFVPCFTFSDNPIVITPSLPSSPDIACSDILTGQGFANCISSVFAWLFLPHQDTIDEFFQLSSLIKTKIPFGYVYSFRDEINNLTSSSSSDFSVALTFNGDDQVPVINSDTFDALGSDFKSNYFRFIRAILWIFFGVWVFNLGRKIFLDDRDN